MDSNQSGVGGPFDKASHSPFLLFLLLLADNHRCGAGSVVVVVEPEDYIGGRWR